jgi:hypothetical protein
VVQPVHGKIGRREASLVQEGPEGIDRIVASREALGEVHPGQESGPRLVKACGGGFRLVAGGTKGRMLFQRQPCGIRKAEIGTPADQSVRESDSWWQSGEAQ